MFRCELYFVRANVGSVFALLVIGRCIYICNFAQNGWLNVIHRNNQEFWMVVRYYKKISLLHTLFYEIFRNYLLTQDKIKIMKLLLYHAKV